MPAFEDVTPGDATVPPDAKFAGEDLHMGKPGLYRVPLRMTFKEWKRWVHDRRAWRRRVVVAAGAVLIAEASCALAWTSLTAALAAPTRRG